MANGAEKVTEADILAHSEQFVRRKGRLKVFVAPTATFLFGVDGEYRQLCQVGYGADGSIRVAWPYVAVKEGIVSEVMMPGDGQPHRIKLQERGRFTSQLVKFSHHVSGRAHFSLTGKVQSDVGRQSFRLDGPIGRVFELTITFPEAFKPLPRLKRDRLYVNFTGKVPFPDALQIRGEWRRKSETVTSAHSRAGSVGPATMRLHKPTGEVAPVAFLSPPLECAVKDHMLLITCHPVELPGGADKPGIIFMGAFDQHEGPAPSVTTARFLTAMFPTSSTEEVRSAVGTIDLS